MSTQQGLLLKKGENASLTTVKDGIVTSGLVMAAFGLGWNIKAGAPDDADLDVIALCLDANGKLIGSDQILYWGVAQNKGIPAGQPFDILNGMLAHTGDNRTGEGEGDDETITANIQMLAQQTAIHQIAIVAQCYNIDRSGSLLTFGQVDGCYIRAFDTNSASPAFPELRFDLNEDYSGAECIWFGSLYVKDDQWKFRAKGEVVPTPTPGAALTVADIAQFFSK